jgi:hypothetical protein
MRRPTFCLMEKMSKATQFLTKRDQTVQARKIPFGAKHAVYLEPRSKKTCPKIQAFTCTPVTENLFLTNNSANRLAKFAMMSHLFRAQFSYMARDL